MSMAELREPRPPPFSSSKPPSYIDNCSTTDPEGTVLQVPLLLEGSHQLNKPSTMRELGPHQLAGASYVTVLKRAGAEMIAVFLIILTSCGTTIANAKIHGDLTLLGLASSGGFSVMMMVFAVGHISGAHLNPAVTIAFASKRLFPLVLVPIYVLAQFLGALIAAGVLVALFDNAEASITVPFASNTQSFVVEMIAGFNLMFVATSVSTGSHTTGELAGIAVGATVILNVLFAGPISGASMNPVRSLGPAVVANRYDGIWIYLLGPPLGALAGTWTHTLLQIV